MQGINFECIVQLCNIPKTIASANNHKVHGRKKMRP